jgi:hypothetical protein
VGEEKRKALITEIYGAKADTTSLPPEVLYFSSVFDWVEPDKEELRKSHITSKLPTANALNVNFGATIAGGVAGYSLPKERCLSFYELDHYYDSMHEYMVAKMQMLEKYIRIKRELVSIEGLISAGTS